MGRVRINGFAQGGDCRCLRVCRCLECVWQCVYKSCGHMHRSPLVATAFASTTELLKRCTKQQVPIRYCPFSSSPSSSCLRPLRPCCQLPHPLRQESRHCFSFSSSSWAALLQLRLQQRQQQQQHLHLLDPAGRKRIMNAFIEPNNAGQWCHKRTAMC